MTPADKDRYISAYDAAFPGDSTGRDDEELWEIAEWMRSVETANSTGLAARYLFDAGYAAATPEEPGRCIRLARTIRAALGIVDPPELPPAADIAARLAEVERERDEARAERDAYKRAKAENDERFMLERDEARAERDRFRAMLDAERGVRGPSGWVWGSMWIADGRLVRPVTGRREDGTIGRVWEWSCGVLVDGERRLAGGTCGLALEAMEAADAAKEEG